MRLLQWDMCNKTGALPSGDYRTSKATKIGTLAALCMGVAESGMMPLTRQLELVGR
jgi:hypothetical protein